MTVSRPTEGWAVAFDQFETGEFSLTRVRDEVYEGDSLRTFAVAKLDWPITNESVQRARRNLLKELEQSSKEAVDPAAFRILFKPGDLVELLIEYE
mmetsp:Transcript_27109/g.88620  ORF Transcript_27109/g.88620 Transcript_27109/m.88620 type:complete len:96 (+) Transcript_27109:1244-1531(+)